MSICKMNETRIITGSYDKTIKIVQMSKENLVVTQTLQDHKDWVKSITKLDNTSFATASDDKSIIIW